MTSRTSVLRPALWQLASLHFFAVVVSLKAALSRFLGSFVLTLRGVAATTSLLSIMFVENKSKRVRMWRQRFPQIHGKSILESFEEKSSPPFVSRAAPIFGFRQCTLIPRMRSKHVLTSRKLSLGRGHDV